MTIAQRTSDRYLLDMAAHLSAKANQLADKILVEQDVLVGNMLLDELDSVIAEHKLVTAMLASTRDDQCAVHLSAMCTHPWGAGDAL